MGLGKLLLDALVKEYNPQNRILQSADGDVYLIVDAVQIDFKRQKLEYIFENQVVFSSDIPGITHGDTLTLTGNLATKVDP